MWAKDVGVLVYLWCCAAYDWKERSVALVPVILAGAIGTGYSFWGQRYWWDYAAACVIGLFFVSLSFLTKGKMGMGDGWLLLSLGMLLDIREYLVMVFLSLLLAAFCGMILLVFCKKRRNTEIPFVPFLLLAYVGGLYLL